MLLSAVFWLFRWG